MLLCLHVFIISFLTVFSCENNATLSQKPEDIWDELDPFRKSSNPSENLRLPTDIMPSFYRLKLTTDIENSNFSGDVFITLRASKKVKEIILHSKYLNIEHATLREQIYQTVTTGAFNSVPDKSNAAENETIVSSSVSNQTATITNIPRIDANTQVTHSSVRNVKILSITSSPGDRMILTLESVLKTDVDYTLQLSFSGNISNSLTGFYKSSYVDSNYKTKTLAVTQFEPTSARTAFPCFDEPDFKAQFEISIAHSSEFTVLSNMGVATQEPMPEKQNWQWTHFERSVRMSTYLVAYILSDLKSQETTYLSKDNITKAIRVWTRPELLPKTKYALKIAPKLLSFYEDLFGVPYALDKIDLVAIPDFASGAMENWGLITFRETSLVYDEETGIPRDKMTVAISVAHELAHQWFGNLVTMRWWTDLWLNEGFATYIEYVGVDQVEPSWGMLEAFSRDKMDLLRSDALKNTSPVSRKVVDATEISQKFDEISYTKGANLIRMLNHTISENVFRKGLVYYLHQWKYTNAQENDLWQAMFSASHNESGLEGRSLVEFMNSWTRQAGYPVVMVTRNYETGEVKFEQKLFTSSKKPYKSMVSQLWQIPVSYTSVEAPIEQWSTRPLVWFSEKSFSTPLPLTSKETLYVNVNAIGYYRVNYDRQNWKLLSNALKSGLVKSPVARSQLIDDAFNLAKANLLNYSQALDLTTFMINGDDSKMVWDLLLNNMAFLRHSLKATSGFSHFQDYAKILLHKQLEKLNFGLKEPKDDNEALLIENLLTWDCYAESERCLNWAKNQFDKWMKQPDFNSNNTIPNHLRPLVYSMAVRHGGRREFDFLWRVFQNASDPSVKNLIIGTLPLTNEPGLVTMLLEKSLSEIPQQYAVSVWNVEPPVGTGIAQQFMFDNFDRVLARFTGIDTFMFPSVLTGTFGLITSEHELNELKSFVVRHKKQLEPMSQTLQKLVDTAELRVRWIRQHSAEITQWFCDYLQSHPPLPMASSGA